MIEFIILYTKILSIIDKEIRMKHQLSIEEINRLEEECRTVRSTVIFSSFAALFGGSRRMVSSLFERGRKTNNRWESDRVGVC